MRAGRVQAGKRNFGARERINVRPEASQRTRRPAVAKPRPPTAYAVDEASPTRGRRALRHAGRGARFILIATIPFLVLIALGIALTFVRLKHGPISLSFLVSPIERSINAVIEGYVVRVGDAIVRLTEDSRIEFRLQNIQFAEADGDLVASSPLAAIEISRKALLQGQVVPSRVELIQPELFVTYSKAKGLGVSFSAPGSSADAAPANAVPEPAARRSQMGVGMLKELDFSSMLQSATSDVRARNSPTSFLRELGVRDATLHVDNQGHRSRWQLPEVAIDLDHRERRSVISGRARVASGTGSWRVGFHTEEEAGKLTLRASLRDLVPAALFDNAHSGSLLSLMDMPVGADVVVGFANGGGVGETQIDIELGRGSMMLRDSGGDLNPIAVEAGLIKLKYDAAERVLELLPSRLRAVENEVILTGTARANVFPDGDGWSYEVRSVSGVLGASEFSVPPVVVDRLQASGRYMPARSEIVLDGAALSAGGTSISAKGLISIADDKPGVTIEGSAEPMSLATLKAIWPTGLAPKSRGWVGTHVLTGQLKQASFKRQSGIFAQGSGVPSDNRMSVAIEATDASFRPTDTMSPISVPRVLITVENDHLEVSVPDAAMMLPSGKSIALKGGRMKSDNIHAEPSDAEVSFRALGDVLPAIELLRQEPIAILRQQELPVKSLEGKVDAQLTLAFPMVKDLPASAIKVSGKAKVADARAQKLLGEYDVQGASVAFDFNNGAVEAKGEAIVRGVLARIAWQHIFDAPLERQPPLRITATLDNSDRNQLGLDLNHIVQGDVPIDLQVVRGAHDTKVHVRADLTNAEVALQMISWRKAHGRSAFAEFDIAAAPHNKYELQNFRVAGDNIAVDGWASVGADRKLREFYFPDFSLNVVTRLKVQGNLRDDNVWDIKVRGPTFDGKDFYRALFNVGRTPEKEDKSAKSSGGVDIDAQVDNVLGFADVSLRALKVTGQSRAGKLTALDARGTIDGGAQLAVVLDRDSSGQRRIRADTADAGQAFKAIGFYPNMQKGRARLEVNVDGRGAADKTGTLWVEDFRVLGDPVVSEVVSSGISDGRPSIDSGKRMVREVFEFDTMRVPFSVGQGQFAMEDAYVRGPLLGATIRGKVDYKTERVNLGGTYIPLQGLNNAFGQIPVLGQILSGPRGEGIFGITFAVQGAMAEPQVIVNPLSLVAPGIFREVFQMANPSTTVQERKPEPTKGRKSTGASSSAPAVKRGQSAPSAGATIDGWSSDTR